MLDIQRGPDFDGGFVTEVKQLVDDLAAGELQPEAFLSSIDVAVETSHFRQFGARPTAEATGLLDPLSRSNLALRRISRI